MKIARVLQAFGLGDIIFTISLVRKFIAQNYTIEWPVMDCFIDGLSFSYPDIHFIPVSTVSNAIMNNLTMGIVDDILNMPIRFSAEIMKVKYKDVMRAKYDMYDLDWCKWKEQGMFRRNHEKEQQLHHALVPRENGCYIPYNLINCNFRSNGSGKIKIDPKNGLHNVYINFQEGYSLFDYSYLIENATEIHTVSTSIIYVLELLTLDVPIHIYKRTPDENNHDNYSYIFESHNYIFH